MANPAVLVAAMRGAASLSKALKGSKSTWFSWSPDYPAFFRFDSESLMMLLEIRLPLEMARELANSFSNLCFDHPDIDKVQHFVVTKMRINEINFAVTRRERNLIGANYITYTVG